MKKLLALFSLLAACTLAGCDKDGSDEYVYQCEVRNTINMSEAEQNILKLALSGITYESSRETYKDISREEADEQAKVNYETLKTTYIDSRLMTLYTSMPAGSSFQYALVRYEGKSGNGTIVAATIYAKPQ